MNETPQPKRNRIPVSHVAQVWLALLSQENTVACQRNLLKCVLLFDDVSPLLVVIQKALKLKLQEIIDENPATRKPFIFEMDLSVWLGGTENIVQVPFSAGQAVWQLETLLGKRFDKSINMVPYFGILQTIVGNMAMLCHIFKYAERLDEDDEAFCIATFSSYIRLGVILYPAMKRHKVPTSFHSDRFNRTSLNRISDRFLQPDFKHNSGEFIFEFGLKVCRGALRIFASPVCFITLMSPATDHIIFLKKIIDSKFRTQLLPFCAMVTSSLFTSCNYTIWNAPMKRANYWLALNMALMIIRTVPETHPPDTLTLDELSRVAFAYTILFECHVGAKIGDEEDRLCNLCLVNYAVTIILTKILEIVPQVIDTADIRVYSLKGCLVLVHAATGNPELFRMFVQAMCRDIKSAITFEHTTRVAASAFLYKFLLISNESKFQELDSSDFPYKDLLQEIIAECLAGNVRCG